MDINIEKEILIGLIKNLTNYLGSDVAGVNEKEVINLLFKYLNELKEFD